jgi:hypothetical protein
MDERLKISKGLQTYSNGRQASTVSKVLIFRRFLWALECGLDWQKNQTDAEQTHSASS